MSSDQRFPDAPTAHDTLRTDHLRTLMWQKAYQSPSPDVVDAVLR